MIISLAACTFSLVFDNTLSTDEYYLNGLRTHWSRLPEPKEQDFTVFIKKKPTEKLPATLLKRGNAGYYEENDKIYFVDKRSFNIIDWNSSSMIITPADGTNIGATIIRDLEYLISLILNRQGGFLVHSSAVEKACSGLMFLGQSGAGKTTISSLLAPDWNIINEEINAVVKKSSKYYIYNTPFGPNGLTSGNGNDPATLTNMFLLKKSIGNKTAQLSLKEKILSFTGNLFMFPTSDDSTQRVFENAAALCDQIPFERLSFANDHTIRRDIERFIAEKEIKSV